MLMCLFVFLMCVSLFDRVHVMFEHVSVCVHDVCVSLCERVRDVYVSMCVCVCV